MFSRARVFAWLIVATFGCLSQFSSTPVSAEEAWRANTQWIDVKTCTETLPYIQMSKDVYGDEAGPEIPPGWRRLDNWEAVFRKSGSANLIEDAKAVLLVGAVFGRLHGASGDKNAAIGRLCGNHECRVVPGLLFFSLIYRGGGDRHRLRRLGQRRRRLGGRLLYSARAACRAATAAKRGNSLGEDHRRKLFR